MNQPIQPKVPSSEHLVLISALQEDLAAATEQLEHATSEHEELLSDQDTLQEDRDSAAQILAEASATVARIETAIERAEAGTYGVCERCGSAIPAERLAVLPDASTCVACA